MSLESKLKISEAAKKRLSNPKNHPMFGKKISDKTKLALLKTHKGVKMSASVKEKIRIGNLGKKLPKEVKIKISESNKGKHIKYGEDNSNWRKETKSKSSSSRHAYLRRRIKMPKYCQICNKNKPRDLANVSQEYRYNDLSDWIYLCRSCHVKQDGRWVNILGKRK